MRVHDMCSAECGALVYGYLVAQGVLPSHTPTPRWTPPLYRILTCWTAPNDPEGVDASIIDEAFASLPRPANARCSGCLQPLPALAHCVH